MWFSPFRTTFSIYFFHCVTLVFKILCVNIIFQNTKLRTLIQNYYLWVNTSYFKRNTRFSTHLSITSNKAWFLTAQPLGSWAWPTFQALMFVTSLSSLLFGFRSSRFPTVFSTKALYAFLFLFSCLLIQFSVTIFISLTCFKSRSSSLYNITSYYLLYPSWIQIFREYCVFKHI